MSATGRGRERADSDFYKTPPGSTKIILPLLRGLGITPSGDEVWLDPFAGDGAILKVVAAFDPGRRRHAVELRSEEQAALSAPCEVDIGTVAHDVRIADALEHFVGDHYPGQFLLTNPPYSMVYPVLRHFVPRFDYSAWLLRLNMVQHGKHTAWFEENPPRWTYVLSQRPVFCWPCSGKGGKCERSWPVGTTVCLDCGGKPRPGNDASAYAWMIWDRTWDGDYTETRYVMGGA